MILRICGLLLGGLMMTACNPGESEIWVVERDMPQTRNLVPVLNRTTIVAAGEAAETTTETKAAPTATCAIRWTLAEPNVRKGPFWPEFGARARMGVPVLIPEGFPDPDPRLLGEPEIVIGEEGKGGRGVKPGGGTRTREQPPANSGTIENTEKDADSRAGVREPEREAVIIWAPIELAAGEGAAAHASVWLGPPDMYHTAEGLRFGDIRLDTEYEIELSDDGDAAGTIVSRHAGEDAGAVVSGVGDGRTGGAIEATELSRLSGRRAAKLTCRLVLRNTHPEAVVEDLEFAFFLPRALLNNETGAEIPLLESFAFEADGFSEPVPLDLLISDGLGRGAWGPRFTLRRDRLEPGESLAFRVAATGEVLDGDGEALIVPLVSLVARIPARYWASSEIEVSPPGRVHYSDYTHFNLVVADSRMVRMRQEAGTAEATVESSSAEVRKYVVWLQEIDDNK